MVAGWVAHRRLLPWALAALVSFCAAAAVTQPVVHVALASVALAACAVAAAQAFRGEPAPSGPWRDYVTPTKPRIMSLLLIPARAGCSWARRVPPLADLAVMLVGLALACGGAKRRTTSSTPTSTA